MNSTSTVPDSPPRALITYKMHIGGKWVDSKSGGSFETDDPFTGQPWALIPRGGAVDVDRAVKAAHTTASCPHSEATSARASVVKAGRK